MPAPRLGQAPASDNDRPIWNSLGHNAQPKGTGTINGDPASTGELYHFMIWGGDGTGSGGEDTFRIWIWYEVDGAETVVNDNGFDQPSGGGSTTVHTR